MVEVLLPLIKSRRISISPETAGRVLFGSPIRDWETLKKMAYALRKNDVSKLNRVLQDLVVRSESSACLICDNSGYVLAQEGVKPQDSMLLSALGAGVFAASRELAALLGESQFSSVFHQGDKKSIFISAVNEEVLLVTIFSNESSVGLVKLYARPAARAIHGIVDEASRREEIVESPEHHFVLNMESDDPVFSAPGKMQQ